MFKFGLVFCVLSCVALNWICKGIQSPLMCAAGTCPDMTQELPRQGPIPVQIIKMCENYGGDAGLDTYKDVGSTKALLKNLFSHITDIYRCNITYILVLLSPVQVETCYWITYKYGSSPPLGVLCQTKSLIWLICIH